MFDEFEDDLMEEGSSLDSSEESSSEAEEQPLYGINGFEGSSVDDENYDPDDDDEPYYEEDDDLED